MSDNRGQQTEVRRRNLKVVGMRMNEPGAWGRAHRGKNGRQTTEDGRWMTENRCQRTEVRRQKAEFGSGGNAVFGSSKNSHGHTQTHTDFLLCLCFSV